MKIGEKTRVGTYSRMKWKIIKDTNQSQKVPPTVYWRTPPLQPQLSQFTQTTLAYNTNKPPNPWPQGDLKEEGKDDEGGGWVGARANKSKHRCLITQTTENGRPVGHAFLGGFPVPVQFAGWYSVLQAWTCIEPFQLCFSSVFLWNNARSHSSITFTFTFSRAPLPHFIILKSSLSPCPWSLRAHCLFCFMSS